jgi:hypothetical protein
MRYISGVSDDLLSAQADFRRYAALIEPMLRGSHSFSPEAEDSRAVQVERGLVFPSLLTGSWSADAAVTVDRLVELSTSPQLSQIAVVDRSGHHRPVYRGLLIYSWLQAFRLAYETMPREVFGRWEEGLRPWCDVLEGEIGAMEWPTEDPPTIAAGRGSSATEAAWNALALFVAGRVFVRDAWTDLAGDVFGRIARAQQATGALLAATAHDNPETHWYHELVLLHACASYAVQAEDRTVAAAVERNGDWQIRETQPDHATGQPWGVFALLWNAKTRSLAEQVIHGASVAGIDGVPVVLLADALYCLRLFL